MEKEIYLAPEMEIVEFSNEDVIVTSTAIDENDQSFGRNSTIALRKHSAP